MLPRIRVKFNDFQSLGGGARLEASPGFWQIGAATVNPGEELAGNQRILCYGSHAVSEEKRPVAQRRYAGGARREASDRVAIRRPEGEADGWTLNVSRGGLRVVVEVPLRVGELVDVVVGSAEEAPPRSARVVWVKDAADGQICGLQWLDTSGSIPPPDEPLDE